MADDRALQLLQEVQGEFHPFRHGQRLRALRRVLEEHPEAWLVRCADERTGRRFGQAVCRRGHAVKIGQTGWNGPHGTPPYQLWAVWEER